MITRRTLLATLASAALLQSTPLASAGNQVQVEIIALSHWPVQNALKPMRELLKGYGDKIVVQEMDAEATDGATRIHDVGVKGHVPVLILINGAYKFPRADGSVIEFLSFPVGAENPLNLNGAWNTIDVEYVLNNLTGG